MAESRRAVAPLAVVVREIYPQFTDKKAWMGVK